MSFDPRSAPRRPEPSRTPRLTLAAVALLAAGCAAHAPLRAEMEPLPIAQPAPSPLQVDHFRSDRSTAVSEEAIREILRAPVFLEAASRIGIVPVRSRYEPDKDVPLNRPPGRISEALEASGLFEVTTEVSTDWPAHSGIGGLRELAARYRCEYLLMYRHRFVDREWTNGWGAMSLTIVGAFVAPMKTLETAGVLEATMFDVQTGTLLFTVYSRVHATSDENVWGNERKLRALKNRLLDEGAEALAEQVVDKTRLLAAARPDPPRERPPEPAAEPAPPPEPEAAQASAEAAAAP